MQDKIPTRKVDTAVYLTAVKEMIKDGQEVPLIITGGSMSSFLAHGRDRILIGRIDRPLRFAHEYLQYLAKNNTCIRIGNHV